MLSLCPTFFLGLPLFRLALKDIDSLALHCILAPSNEGAFGSILSNLEFISFSCKHQRRQIKDITIFYHDDLYMWEHDNITWQRSPHWLPCKQVDYGAATPHGTEIPCFCTSPMVNMIRDAVKLHIVCFNQRNIKCRSLGGIKYQWEKCSIHKWLQDKILTISRSIHYPYQYYHLYVMCKPQKGLPNGWFTIWYQPSNKSSTLRL